MPIAHDPNNYSLGKGVIYFDKLNSDGYEGERDLGNSPSFNSSVALDKLDHYNQRSNIRAKDKTVVLEVTPTVSFTLDEINVENVELMFMGETTETVQAADDDLSYTIDVSTLHEDMIHGNRYYDIGDYRNIGVWTLSYDGGTGVGARGETVTGGTSSATCVILQPGAATASGTMMIEDITGGPFTDGEALTGSGTFAANADGVESFDTTDACISDNATHSTFYTKTTDYTVDSEVGRIYVVEGGSLDGVTDDTDVEFGVSATTYSIISGFAESSIEGLLRFVPDNPVGNNMELQIWRVDLAPGGDVAMIGDDWAVLEFTGEILKDETNHPNEPYLRVITSDTV